MESFDIVTLGSSTVDIFADTDRDELIEIKSSDSDEELIAYPLGSKLPINNLRQDIGGNGVNVAIGTARLGLDAAYAGKIGDDPNGDLIRNRLDDEGADFIGEKGGNSGLGIILDSHLEDDRTILGYKGCNNTLTTDEIDPFDTEILYCSSLLEESWESMLRLVDKHAETTMVATNPSSTIAVKGLDHLRPLLQRTDILLVNEEEADLIAGQGSKDANLRYLSNMIPTVVMTRGQDGVAAVHENTRYSADSHSCAVEETTGAGDAFSSGFLTGQVKELTFKDSIRLGMLNAENVLCHYGAHNELLTWDKAAELLKDDVRDVNHEYFE